MLQDKDIAKIQEIKTFFTDIWIQPEFFSKQFELFDFTKASKIFQDVKKSGVPVWDVYINRKVYQYFTPKVYHLD